MIKKLRFRFILATMLALTLVLLVILGGINLMSCRKTIADADAILEILAQNNGHFPPRGNPAPPKDDGFRPDSPASGKPFQHRELSPEIPFESRFFSVTIAEDGHAAAVDTGMIAAVDAQTAAQWGEAVFRSGRECGFWGDFRYRSLSTDAGQQVIFLDCGRSLSHFRTTLLASIGISLAGLAAVLVLLILFSARIIRPVAESYEKQKRFITDAGHEIKTPLTVIQADLDLAELECGENEWLSDIRRQAIRLSGLTNDLITLSRMDEELPAQQAIVFPVSDVVEETAQSFLAPAATQGKALSISVEPLLSLLGNEKDIRKLTSILLDNALKYSSENGEITLSLHRKGKNLKLSVSNSIPETMPKQQLDPLFDRFYRADESRETTGGYGLGLSIARGIVTAHRGTIRAQSQAQNLTITVTLPAAKEPGQ